MRPDDGGVRRQAIVDTEAAGERVDCAVVGDILSGEGGILRGEDSCERSGGENEDSGEAEHCAEVDG